MKKLRLACLLALLSCGKPATETTSSDTTATTSEAQAETPATEPAEQTAEEPAEGLTDGGATGEVASDENEDMDPVDENGNPISLNQDATSNTTEENENTEPAKPKEMIYESRSEPISELYYSCEIDGQPATISIRSGQQRDSLLGYVYITGKSERTILKGRWDYIEATKEWTYNWSEYAWVNGKLKPMATVETKLENLNLVGTRYGEDKLKSTPLVAKWVGPGDFKNKYRFLYRKFDDVDQVGTIWITGKGFEQFFEPDPDPASRLRMLTLDINFDNRQDLFLMCLRPDKDCGAHLWLWDKNFKKYEKIAATGYIMDIIDITVDYGNKRILSSGPLKDTDNYYVDSYVITGNEFEKKYLARMERTIYSRKDGSVIKVER